MNKPNFRNIIGSIGWIFLSLLVAVILWEAIVLYADSDLVPSIIGHPSGFFGAFVDSETYIHLSASILLVAKGFLLSVAVALPTAFFVHRFAIFRRIAIPIHEFIRYIPVPAFVPLCAVIFGIGDLTKVVLVFIGTYFQIVFMFLGDIERQPDQFIDCARSLGLNRFQLVFRVLLPSALPDMLTTVRIGFAWAWSYLLVAEVVNSSQGIGYLVLQTKRVLDMERLIGLLIVIGVFGLLVDFGLKYLRRRLCPWQKNN